jgi:hypothetical protein
LATQRAKAVKSIMVDSLRVDASLIQISTDHDKTELHIKRTSVNPKEQKMINEENRRVEFYLDPEEYKKILFGPWKIPTLRTISDSIIFSVEFESPAGVNKWGVKIMDRFKKLVISLTETSRITKTRVSCRIPWHAKNEYGKIVPLNAAYYYLLEIEDAVGRKFETRLDSFYIKTRATIIKEEIFAIAEFNTAKPIYNFYWERLGDVADSLRNNPDLRVRFEGHTCIIGSPSHNDKLSCERSDTLTNAFIDTLQRRESQSDIARVDVNVNARCKNCGFESGLGSGFDEPLTIQIPSSKLFELRIPTPFGLDVQFTIPFHDFKEVLFGDNGTPLGRNLNRRIMICLYKIE